MTRLAMVATWVCIALAQPVSALASDAAAEASARGALPEMCSDNSTSVVFKARSTPASISDSTIDVARPATLDAEVADDSPVAWCLTADDPQCAPRDASSLPDSSGGSVPLSHCEQLALGSSFPAIMAVCRPAQLGAVRAGSRCRLERPPR